jgi:hypothetical protein
MVFDTLKKGLVSIMGRKKKRETLSLLLLLVAVFAAFKLKNNQF